MNHGLDEALPPNADTQQLAVRARAGCRVSFEELFGRFERPLYDFAVHLCNDPEQAEELTQASFVRAWRKIALFDPRWRFSTWLYSIARNLHVDLRRRRRARGETSFDDHAEHGLADPAADPLAAATRNEERENL